jgi:Baseplate J-like protein
MMFSCCSQARRDAILSNPGITLNGIDYLELQATPPSLPVRLPGLLPVQLPGLEPRPPIVLEGPGLVRSVAGLTQILQIHCLRPVPTSLTSDNVLIQGGESITSIHVLSVSASANVLSVVTTVGDFSPYVLRFVRSAEFAAGSPFELTEVLPGFDPQLAEVQFSYHAGVGPSFDCLAPTPDCAPPVAPPPAINYVAKDFGSFRTLILDRLNQLLPDPVGSNEADLAVALAELIAYRADQLSYQQDAVATEAYLETARSRVSLRRHARLVGYPVHDGCNARAWVQLTVAANPGDPVFMDHTLSRFYTYAPGMPTTLAVGAGNETLALAAGVQVFEPMYDAVLFAEHNQISFYTWGESRCCLPVGATEATLQGALPNLQPGDVLIFQEVLGPQTGNAADADLRHRWAVRLTQVAHADAAGNPLIDPLFDVSGAPITSAGQTPMPLTEIQWSAADALPFPLCISSLYLNANGGETLTAGVSVALGNVVLADHGLSMPGADLGVMPAPRFYYPPNPGLCQSPAPPAPLPVRFRPMVPESPLTQAVPLALTGPPTTSSVVLLEDGAASLVDPSGLVSLTASALDVAGWPALFGIIVAANAVTATNIDLTVLYAPQGGAAGTSGPAAVEQFSNLSFNPAQPNYVAAQINSFSSFVRVPGIYTPPSSALGGLPTTPVMLVPGQSITLTDLSTPPIPYLMLQPTAPESWTAAIGLVVQGLETTPITLNLDVLYYPASPVGVAWPVTLEQFSNLSLTRIASGVNGISHLLTVQSFAGMPDQSLSAQDLIQIDPQEALPEISMEGTYEGIATPWSAQRDLLSSGGDDQVFVVEVDSDGTAYLRFATPGDPSSPLQTNGLVPPTGTAFAASYRIGNASAGNVGAESLKFLAAADARIQLWVNPLPASGGTDPETNDQIRRRAPQAFLSQAPGMLARAITMADYEAVAENDAQVNQAVATQRWTGSWYSVFIAVEPVGGGALSPALQQAVSDAVEPCRLAGEDVLLDSPQYVSLQIALDVEVEDGYLRADVEASLLQVLGNQLLPDGRQGLFYPDNFTFGQSVYLSPVYAAARAVAGVATVTATQFEPQGMSNASYLATGEIPLGSLQVARLENDPNYPSHGQLLLSLSGGR